MKTYQNLLRPMLTPEAVCKCALEAAEKKTRRHEVLYAFQHFDETYEEVVACALSQDYTPRTENRHIVKDGTNGKMRTIEKPMFCPEQILHHILVAPFRGIVMNDLYEQVYGCLPATYQKMPDGKTRVHKYGPHAAIRQIRKWVQVPRKTYVAELDVHHAYGSVNIEILMDKLKRTIRDEEWLRLMRAFLRDEEGLTLGHYISPWLFNFYLKNFDHFAAKLNGTKYLRFADNIFLVGRNKRKVHNAVTKIRDYLYRNLKLELNASAQVYRFEYVDRYGKVRGRAVNALGAVIHYNRITLRKRILKRIRRKAMQIEKKKKPTWHDGASMFSRLSWIRCTNTYQYYIKYIKPRINTRALKQKVREHSRLLQPLAEMRRQMIYDGLDQSEWLAGRAAIGDRCREQHNDSVSAPQHHPDRGRRRKWSKSKTLGVRRKEDDCKRVRSVAIETGKSRC